MSVEDIKLTSRFQKEYYKDESDILLVGGAASSSKTYIGLMKHLRNCHDPNYVGYCIRKNSSAIVKAGGLFQEAVELYKKYDPKIQVKIKDQKIVFSSGAQVVFSHYDSDKAADLYQGLQISGIMVDESTHLEEHQIWWLISRLRSKANCKHQIWLTCNPDNNSWLLKYAIPYLHQEGHPLAGRPNKEINGTVRWLLRNGNDIVWGNSPEELKEKYGSKVVPRSFRALFGTIRDNPVLRKMRPEYESVLLSLPRVERERLYYGNWFARPEGSGYWSADWCEEILCPPTASEFTKICRAYDFAGTLPNELNHGRCDYTACVKFGKLRSGDYVILEVIRHHIRFGDWEDFILENARRDGSRVDIILPIDPNPAAEASTRMLVRKITSEGYFVTTKKTNDSKVDRFRPFASACQNGLVRIVRNCATDLWDLS